MGPFSASDPAKQSKKESIKALLSLQGTRKSPRADGNAKNAKLCFTCFRVSKLFTHADRTERVDAVKHYIQNKARFVVL